MPKKCYPRAIMKHQSTETFDWFEEHSPTLPFTAFGQFGEGGFDIRVLEQDEWWVNIHGEPFLLTEMSHEYLNNVKIMLHREAIMYHMLYVQQTMDSIIADYTAGKLNGDVLNYELTGTTVADMPHDEWINSMPLMRRIDLILSQENK